MRTLIPHSTCFYLFYRVGWGVIWSSIYIFISMFHQRSEHTPALFFSHRERTKYWYLQCVIITVLFVADVKRSALCVNLLEFWWITKKLLSHFLYISWNFLYVDPSYLYLVFYIHKYSFWSGILENLAKNSINDRITHKSTVKGERDWVWSPGRVLVTWMYRSIYFQ